MNAATADMHFLELTQLAARIRARKTSPVAVTRAQLDRIAALDGALASYALVMAGNYLAVARPGVRGLRIGIDAAWNGDGVDAATQAVRSDATEVFRTLGVVVVGMQCHDVTQAVADWAANCAVEAAVAHEATYPARQDEYGLPVGFGEAALVRAGAALQGVTAWHRRHPPV